MQGTNEEVSPDTSMCYLVQRVKSGSYGQSPGTRGALEVSPDCGKVDRSSAACPDEGHPRGGISPKRSSVESGTEFGFCPCASRRLARIGHRTKGTR